MDGINNYEEKGYNDDDCMMAIASPKVQIEAAHKSAEIGKLDHLRNATSSSVQIDDLAD